MALIFLWQCLYKDWWLCSNLLVPMVKIFQQQKLSRNTVISSQCWAFPTQYPSHHQYRYHPYRTHTTSTTTSTSVQVTYNSNVSEGVVGNGTIPNSPQNQYHHRNNNNKQNQNKPTFAQAVHKQASFVTMKSIQKPKLPIRSDSTLGEMHQNRIQIAGRVGTKRYINPCKVFCGNLPIHTTNAELTTWICQQMGLPSSILLQEVKIIYDWKSGLSKGYGFLIFTEAIYATVCIAKCHNQMWHQRIITVQQGIKKPILEESVEYLWKKKKLKQQQKKQQEGATTTITTETDQNREEILSMDPEEIAMLRRLDPDLVPDFSSTTKEVMETNKEKSMDCATISMEGSKKDLFNETTITSGSDTSVEPLYNRKVRREKEREERRRRKKPSNKGFG